jgi:hypothetical protein
MTKSHIGPLTRPRKLAQPIEIFFSIMQRKVVQPQDFSDLPALEKRLLAFQNRRNQTAQPFAWHYTRQDLKRYLARLSSHETAA